MPRIGDSGHRPEPVSYRNAGGILTPSWQYFATRRPCGSLVHLDYVGEGEYRDAAGDLQVFAGNSLGRALMRLLLVQNRNPILCANCLRRRSCPRIETCERVSRIGLRADAGRGIWRLTESILRRRLPECNDHSPGSDAVPRQETSRAIHAKRIRQTQNPCLPIR